MCVTGSRKARPNPGPKAPCGLLSLPFSLGGGPPPPLSVADGLAGISAWETLTLLLAIESAAPSCRTACGYLRSLHAKFDAGDQFIDAASQSQAQPQIAHALARELRA